MEVQQFKAACGERIASPVLRDMCYNVEMSFELEADRQYSFRYADAAITKKVGYLNDLPHKLARARDPPIMRECYNDWLAVDSDKNHRVANLLFDTCSPLFPSSMHFMETEVMRDDLDQFLKGIEEAPMTEEKGEKPHAGMSKEKVRARHASRPWFSATERLPDNFYMYDHMSTDKQELFAKEWGIHKRVLQTNAHREFRNKRISDRKFWTTVYRCSTSCGHFDGARAVVGNRADPASLKAMDLSRREVLKSALEPNTFYTIPKNGGEIPLECFQVIWVVPRNKKFVYTAQHAMRGILEVGITKHDFWRPEDRNLGNLDENSTVDVFPHGGVEVVDMFKMAPWAELRKMMIWQTQSCDAGGFVTLLKPKSAFPRLQDIDFSKDDTPLLFMMDELMRRGWTASTAERPAIPLVTPFASVFAATKLAQRMKPYFMCLLFIGDLFHRGLTTFKHSNNAKYYSVLLRAPRPQDIPTDETAEAYEERLENLQPPDGLHVEPPEAGFVGSDMERSESEDSDPPPQPPRVEPLRPDDGFVGSDNEGSSTSDVPSSSESDDDELPDDGMVGSDNEEPPRELRLPIHLDGRICRLDPHRRDEEERRRMPRLIIKCTCHRKCYKRRGAGPRFTGTLGPGEPAAFLFAWAEAGRSDACPDPVSHRRFRPTLAAQRVQHAKLRAGGYV